MWPHRNDPDAMQACAASLLGTHDFTAFTPARNDHVRFRRDVLRAEWIEEPGDITAFWIEADAFMHNMVRIMVGTMLEVGSGRTTRCRVRRSCSRDGPARMQGKRHPPTASTSPLSPTRGRQSPP